MKTNKFKHSVPLFAITTLSVAFIIAIGCEKEGERAGAYWTQNEGDSSGTQTAAAGDNSGNSDNSGDAVPYSSFNWVYGPADKRYPNATSSGVRISDLNLDANGWKWSFKFDADLSAWGYTDPSHAEILCAFVQTTDGKWIGGMIHWQNSKAPAGDFHNIYPNAAGSLPNLRSDLGLAPRTTSYEGWNLNGIKGPPTQMAFVIVDGKSNRRSNVISANWNWNPVWK